MVKRCRFLNKQEVKFQGGFVITTVYDCCREGHPEYFTAFCSHPACMECDLAEVVED